MANRYPLIFDTQDGNKIKELPSGDNLNLQGSSIVNAIDIQASGTLTVNQLNVNTIPSLATVATSGNYNDLTNKPTIFSGDWDDLQNKPTIFSGDWNDLSNRPVIATKLSQLVNDTNFITNGSAAISLTAIPGLAEVAKTNDYADLDNTPTKLSDFSNDLNYLKASDVADGQLTIEVNNTGNLQGSVLGEDSTVLIDATSSTINLQDTVLDNRISFGLADIVRLPDGQSINISGLHSRATSQEISDYAAFVGGLYGEAQSLLSQYNYLNGISDPTAGAVYAQYVAAEAEYQFYNDRLNNPERAIHFNLQTWKLELGDIKANVEGSVVGDLTGSVFGDDSTVIIDGVNNIVTGTISGNVQTAGTFSMTAGNIQALTTGNFTVPGANTVSLGAITTTDITSGGNINIESTAGLITIRGTGAVSIISGDVGGYSDLDVFAATTTVGSNGEGGAVYLGTGSHVDVVSTADAQSFTLPTYATTTDRDNAITSPVGGEIAYISGTGKFTGYNGQTTTWDDLN
jgi:hypothetical protein